MLPSSNINKIMEACTNCTTSLRTLIYTMFWIESLMIERQHTLQNKLTLLRRLIHDISFESFMDS